MSSDHGDGAARECECGQCRLEELFVAAFRSTWVRMLSPCDELSLVLDLQHERAPGGPILLCVAEVRGAPIDVLAVSQVHLRSFVHALDLHEGAVARGEPDADDKLRSAVATLAHPYVLDRAEVRRVLEGARRLFPGLLEEVLEGSP
jgi:hypothetical protein